MLDVLLVLRGMLVVIGLWTVAQWLRAGWRRLFGKAQPKDTELGADWLSNQDRHLPQPAPPTFKVGTKPIRSAPAYVAPARRKVRIKPTTISFGYRDSKGDITDRTVVVRELQPDTFTGRCLMRGQDRTFKWDRVIGRMVVGDTGEVLHADDAYEGLVG